MRTATYSRNVLFETPESCDLRFVHKGVPVELRFLIIERHQTVRHSKESWHHPDPFFSRIFMFRRGGAVLTMLGRKSRLREGVIYFLPSGSPFTLDYDPSELLFLHIHTTDITRQPVIRGPRAMQRLDRPELFDAFTKALLAEHIPGIFAGTIQAMGFFLRNDMDRLAENARQAERFLRLFEWLGRQPLAAATVASASELYNITPAAFSRRFQRTMGQSFKSYITQLQLKRAQHDLRYTDKQIAEISSELGHSYPQYFHRFFKKHCGCTPGEYREKVRATMR